MPRSKQKTKARSTSTGNPTWNQAFKYPVTDAVDPSLRLQVALWNVGFNNSCVGGFSISIQELRTRPAHSMAGWFGLLSEAKGRTAFNYLGDAAAPSTLKRSLSEESIVSALSIRSVAQSAIVPHKDSTGMLEIALSFSPTNASRTELGVVTIKVRQGTDLTAKAPYLKFYISKDDKDIKSTKTKGSVKKRGKLGKVLPSKNKCVHCCQKIYINKNNTMCRSRWLRLRHNSPPVQLPLTRESKSTLFY